MKAANLYHLRGRTVEGKAATVSNSLYDSDAINLWHMRLGHVSQACMIDLTKKGLLVGCNASNLEFCEHCEFGKHKSVKFNTSVKTTDGILDYVHSDLHGPSREPSLGGARYMLIVTP
ncbi:Uncharacterized mitochondrial protein AtMg00300 [Linum perenne]